MSSHRGAIVSEPNRIVFTPYTHSQRRFVEYSGSDRCDGAEQEGRGEGNKQLDVFLLLSDVEGWGVLECASAFWSRWSHFLCQNRSSTQ